MTGQMAGYMFYGLIMPILVVIWWPVLLVGYVIWRFIAGLVQLTLGGCLSLFFVYPIYDRPLGLVCLYTMCFLSMSGNSIGCFTYLKIYFVCKYSTKKNITFVFMLWNF